MRTGRQHRQVARTRTWVTPTTRGITTPADPSAARDKPSLRLACHGCMTQWRRDRNFHAECGSGTPGRRIGMRRDDNPTVVAGLDRNGRPIAVGWPAWFGLRVCKRGRPGMGGTCVVPLRWGSSANDVVPEAPCHACPRQPMRALRAKRFAGAPVADRGLVPAILEAPRFPNGRPGIGRTRVARPLTFARSMTTGCFRSRRWWWTRRRSPQGRANDPTPRCRLRSAGDAELGTSRRSKPGCSDGPRIPLDCIGKRRGSSRQSC
jgi:hypothetical protein